MMIKINTIQKDIKLHIPKQEDRNYKPKYGTSIT